MDIKQKNLHDMNLDDLKQHMLDKFTSWKIDPGEKVFGL